MERKSCLTLLIFLSCRILSAQAPEVPKTTFNRGLAYWYGQGVPQDYVAAANWYLKAAEQGYAEAQYHLGQMFAIGQGIPHNDAEAAKWYRKAAEQGIPLAQHNLGTMYVFGQGG